MDIELIKQVDEFTAKLKEQKIGYVIIVARHNKEKNTEGGYLISDANDNVVKSCLLEKLELVLACLTNNMAIISYPLRAVASLCENFDRKILRKILEEQKKNENY